MSHELRTPLNGILGYAQILKRDMKLPKRQQHGLDIIEQSGNHLLDLINDILDLAKIESGKIELYLANFSLPALLQHVCEMIRIRAERKGIFFRLEQDERLPSFLHGDEKRLRQVLLNLLGNAVKFTDGGVVTLRVSMSKEAGGGRQEAEFDDGQIADSIPPTADLLFEVEDSGVGIVPEQLKKIFEPFQQVGDLRRKTEGTGLGLAISRRLIELMGGTLSVESTPGRGSTFRFVISVPEAVSEHGNIPKTRQKIVGIRGNAPTLLIVDDNRESRRILSELLHSVGFEIIEASDGDDALKKAGTHHPAAIITDLMMPGMDGLELIHHIRQLPEFSETIIITASASVYEEDRQRCLAAGSHDFLPKPIQTARLFDLLQRHLNVEWVYDPDEQVTQQIARDGIPEQLPDVDSQITTLPAEILDKLERAAISSDIRLMGKLIEGLRPERSALADTLTEFAENFDYEKILEIVRRRISFNEENSPTCVQKF